MNGGFDPLRSLFGLLGIQGGNFTERAVVSEWRVNLLNRKCVQVAVFKQNAVLKYSLCINDRDIQG